MRQLVRMMFVAGALALASTGAMAQRQPGGGGAAWMGMLGGGGGGGLKALLATNKALQDELKLTDDQISKVKAFQEKQAEATRPTGGPGAGGPGGRPGAGGGFGGGGGFPTTQSDEEQLETAKARVKQLEERIVFFKKALDEKQTTRLNQISLQQQGLAAFNSETLRKKLNISEDQATSIKKIVEESGKEVVDLRSEVFGGGGGGGRGNFDPEKLADFMKKTRAITEDAEEKIVKGMTADQNKMWSEMIGEKFDMAKLVPQRRDN